MVSLNSSKYQLHQDTQKNNMEAVKNGIKYEKSIHENDCKNQTINIASVVHDEICPMLTYLIHDIFWLEKNSECSEVKRRANQCIDQLTNAMNRCRTVLLDLRPNDEGPSLTESLDGMFNKIKMLSGIAVSSDIDHHINQLGCEQQSVIYRSVQESLSNVIKHSHAKHVHVTAKMMHRQVQVRVVDDGIGLGFDGLSPAFCIGLKMQKQRAEDLDGHFSIQNNSNGAGTEIHLSFPLKTNLIYL